MTVSTGWPEMTVCALATVGPAATARLSAVKAEMGCLIAYSICIGEPGLTCRACNSTRVCRLRSYFGTTEADGPRLFQERKIAALRPSRNHRAMPAAAAAPRAAVRG